MYKCDVCNKNSEPGVKAEKFYSFRPKTYHNTVKVKGDRKKTREIVSHGNEITKEFTICKTCQESR